MNWKSKAHVLAVLSRVPAGERCYSALQACLGTNELDIDEYLTRALEITELARQAGRESITGTCLEIGTGWWPVLPLVLYLCGAESVVTFDIHPWLSARRASRTLAALGHKLEVIAERVGVDEAAIKKRYAAASPNGKNLDELLRACRIEYRCPGDARSTRLPVQTVDAVCSSNVLEHVPIEVLRAIHRESARVLKPGGLAIHRINPGDHYATIDRSITTVNFLQFDSRTWHWYGGSGLAFHNRLRCVQHRDMLKESGFSIAVERVRLDERAYQALKVGDVRVHGEFRSFTAEELAADYIWLVGIKDPASRGSDDAEAIV